jgi:hypothetical protein
MATVMTERAKHKQPELSRRSIITCESLHLFTHFCLILAQHCSNQHNHDFVFTVVASGPDLSLCLVHIRPSIFAAETVYQCPSHPPRHYRPDQRHRTTRARPVLYRPPSSTFQIADSADLFGLYHSCFSIHCNIKYTKTPSSPYRCRCSPWW